ncbi:hypothetical protein Pori4_00173 [Pseudomonas phage vB_PpuM-Pori-4]
MKWFTWVQGRAGQYRKMLLFQWRSGDCYLIRYMDKQGIAWHVDPVEGKRHWRLNIVLKGSTSAFQCPEAKIKGRFNLFRPDINRHRVLCHGPRLVLSIGWVLTNKEVADGEAR